MYFVKGFRVETLKVLSVRLKHLTKCEEYGIIHSVDKQKAG